MYDNMLSYSVLNFKTEYSSDFLQETLYNLLDTTFIIPIEGFEFEVYEVTDEYIARPDLISLDAYGTTLYADVICKLNGISNPFELNEGMMIILPTGDCVDNFIVREPQDAEKDTILSNVKPVAKGRTEKRRANEAVIGDTRFRIDQKNGVIIY